MVSLIPIPEQDKTILEGFGIKVDSIDDEVHAWYNDGNSTAKRMMVAYPFGESAFLISPVRRSEPRIDAFMLGYLNGLALQGVKGHYPRIHTNQDDPIGYNICVENAKAIQQADFVHLYYDPASTGSLFDIGMAFGNKHMYIINPQDLKKGINNPFRKISNVASFIGAYSYGWGEQEPFDMYSLMEDERKEMLQEHRHEQTMKWYPLWNDPDNKPPSSFFLLFGMAFMDHLLRPGKKIYASDPSLVQRTPKKSFANVLLELDARARGEPSLYAQK